jgi:DNA polymerase-3 subunit epsilon
MSTTNINISQSRSRPGSGRYKQLKLCKPERAYKKPCILEENNQIDTSQPFYDKIFVFTGTLQAMVRSKAQKLVLKRGGSCKNSITPSVNYLVMGVQGLRVDKDGKSNKLKKAEKLLSKGGKIEPITEDEFLRLLSYIKSDLHNFFPGL